MHPKLTVRIERLIVDLLRDIGLIPLGGSSKLVISAEIHQKSTSIYSFYPDEIQILIKMMDDTLATIAVNPSDSISNVKKKIHRLCKCPSDQLRLVFAGKKLEDDLTLNHYNVQNKSTLHLVQRLPRVRDVARNLRRDANGNDTET